MMHKSRTWCIFPIATKEDLAHKLAESTWCLCTAFEIGDYLFLNDATSEDGAAEYAVLKKPATAEAPYMQIESITASWMSEAPARIHLPDARRRERRVGLGPACRAQAGNLRAALLSSSMADRIISLARVTCGRHFSQNPS